jgi:hypothetical protein
LVAIRYSQARNPGPPSKLSRLRQAQEGLLDQVLGLLERAEHPVAVHVQLTAVAPDQLGERRLVPALGGLDDRVLGVPRGVVARWGMDGSPGSGLMVAAQ